MTEIDVDIGIAILKAVKSAQRAARRLRRARLP
jgi:hypothetical protein